MRITRIELFRYKPFLHNEIELFEMDMPSSIQNIIGTNGSGKTSLLRELNPNPAVRTRYGECGYKKIVIVSGNTTYVLTSDFTNLSSPHSFVKDDEELNSSGTTAVQEELVANHLGYTQMVHSICYGAFPLSKMQVGMRKSFLLTAHPCQMKIILDKHKKVNAALRACRDNLSMLQERRASLSSQLIEESVKASLLEDKTKYETELGLVIEATHRLNNQRSNIQKELDSRSIPGDMKSRSDIIALKPKYTVYYYIPKEVPVELCRNNTINEITMLSTTIENLSRRVRELTLEIDKYEQHIRANDAKGALELIESSISTLAMDIYDLEQKVIDNPFDSYVIDKIPEQISYLTDLVSFFIGYNGYIPATKEVHQLRIKLEKNNGDAYRIKRDEADMQQQVARYERELLSTQIDNIPTSCAGCVLFENYRNTLTLAQLNYNGVEKQLRKIQLRRKRIDLVLEGRFEKLKLWEQAVPQMQRISEFLNENRYLLIALKDVDLLQTLRRNPSALAVKIQTHYNLSRDTHDLRKKRETLDKLILEQEKLKTPSEFGQMFLEQMVAEKHTELNILRDEYVERENDRVVKLEFLNLLNSYEEDLSSIKRDYEASKALETYSTLVHERAMCDLYITHLTSMKQQIFDRLTEIERILREQDSIMARYRDEVMVNIERISFQEAEFAEIERALSPTTGIAHRYMVQFINDLFLNANLFMSEIFSYPLEFLYLEDNATLDYKFKMKVGDVTIPDVSEGSDAQMEVANFAFNLALVIQREQSQFGLMLDEAGKSFDSHHKQKLVEFLKVMIDDGLVSQLFLINHHATISAGLLNSNTVVLNPENIVVPEIYNEYVHMEKY